jgi:hypothetical protein
METDRIRLESDSDSNVLEYEYKTDVSNLETHSDIYYLEDNIYQFSLLKIYNYKIM